jgi:hypothetical protein
VANDEKALVAAKDVADFGYNGWFVKAAIAFLSKRCHCQVLLNLRRLVESMVAAGLRGGVITSPLPTA